MRRLIEAEQIRQRVAILGERITADYRGSSLCIVGVLNGGVVLVADLIRQIDLPIQLGFVRASSYPGTSVEAGKLTIDFSQLPSVAGRDVLVVDDIFDSGRTYESIVKAMADRGACSVKGVVLLWKEARRRVDLVPDYFCFSIPDLFVVGYGLDYNNDHRHLPHIAALDAGEF